jgi:hypothetical protein
VGVGWHEGEHNLCIKGDEKGELAGMYGLMWFVIGVPQLAEWHEESGTWCGDEAERSCG